MGTRIPLTERQTLSTGQVVELPLEVRCAVGGLVVPARRRALEAVLPEPLEPVSLAPGVGCVTLVGIGYDRVGGSGGDAFEPYDEFAVIIPTLERPRVSTWGLSLLGATLGGYVHWLPVTSDASVALGRECWGYPKERAEISVTDGPSAVRTTLETADGGHVRLSVPRPRRRSRSRDWSLTSYTDTGEEVLAIETHLHGRLSIRPAFGGEFSMSDDLDPLAELGLWNRPLFTVTGSRVQGRIDPGETVTLGLGDH